MTVSLRRKQKDLNWWMPLPESSQMCKIVRIQAYRSVFRNVSVCMRIGKKEAYTIGLAWSFENRQKGSVYHQSSEMSPPVWK